MTDSYFIAPIMIQQQQQQPKHINTKCRTTNLNQQPTTEKIKTHEHQAI